MTTRKAAKCIQFGATDIGANFAKIAGYYRCLREAPRLREFGLIQLWRDFSLQICC